MFTPDYGQGAKPLYEQLYQYFRREIERGSLAAGERLPSRRDLSIRCHLNPGTIANAYAQLVAEGYVESRERSGHYVCIIEGGISTGVLPANFNEKISKTIKSVEEKTRARQPHVCYTLRTDAVDTEHFPFPTWSRLMRACIAEDSRSLLEQSAPQGDLELRREIARYLKEYRDVDALPEQIVIGAGSEYLLGLLVQLLGRTGRYALENPGYEKNAKILRAYGADVSFVPLDEQGVRADAVSSSGVSFLHVSPSHHFPLGTVMPVARRMRILQWAAADPARYIIEDDYDSEFRFAGRPIPAMQSLEAGRERVVYLNTFAKSLAPSLRIGYMVLPMQLARRYRETMSFYACTVPRFEQRTLMRFLSGGYFQRHLNRMKKIYRSRRDAFLDALAHACGKRIAVAGADTGLHLLLRPHTGMNEEELIKHAEAFGVLVQGLSRYYHMEKETAPASTVVVGYAGCSEKELQDAAGLLAQAWF